MVPLIGLNVALTEGNGGTYALFYSYISLIVGSQQNRIELVTSRPGEIYETKTAVKSVAFT